jgi:hypothetical protein
LQFLHTAVYAKLGRANLRAIYRRANFGGRKLAEDLRCSLWAALQILEHAPPRYIELNVPRNNRPIIYADAFFEMDAHHFKLSHFTEVPDLAGTLTPSITNGWGIVFARKGHRTEYMRGCIPSFVFEVLRSKKTYIFLLEVVAQCMGLWIFGDRLEGSYWSFVDNVGARFSLTRGYSRDPDANSIISLFWLTVLGLGAAPWFEHVPSDAQLADAVSRADYTEADRQGWLEIQADLDPIWELLVVAISCKTPISFELATQLLERCSEVRRRSAPFTMG